MIENNAIEIFKDYFKGRSDVFAEQTSKGSYFPIRRNMTAADICAHLNGKKSYGIYPINPKNNCCWLTVIDIDDKNISFVQKIKNAAYKIGLDEQQIICEISGNKGYHIWIFYAEPIDAIKARSLGKIIVSLSEIERDIEVFPKQNRIDEKGFGSLVKLPLGIHKVSGKKSYFLNHKFEVVKNWREYLSEIQKVSKEQVEDILKEYNYLLEQDYSFQNGTANGDDSSGLPCINKILREGVDEGNRDNICFRLAVYFKKCCGAPADITILILENWNKKNKPPLDHATLIKKVESAYKNGYKGLGCNSEYMKEFCNPEECPVKKKILT